MTIHTLTEIEYNILTTIQKEFPNLTFQNNGFEYIDKSKFSMQDKVCFELVTEILKKSVVGFQTFNNFRVRKENGEICVRFQYDWTADDINRKISFTGVGYLTLRELLNGFDKSMKAVEN